MIGSKSILHFPSILSKSCIFGLFYVSKIGNRALKLQGGISKNGNRALKLQDGISKNGNRALKLQGGISKIGNRALKLQDGISKNGNKKSHDKCRDFKKSILK